jgi:hypothetical protein
MNEQTVPIEVSVTNFPPIDRNKVTTFKTYIIDPTGVAGPKFQQICDYEPRRCRLVIISPETDICVTLEVPVLSPDPTVSGANAVAPVGAFLPSTITADRAFYGPDAMWVNSVAAETAGRVTVIKEYQ